MRSLVEADVKLVVKSNYTTASHPQQCNCGLCSKQGLVLVMNNLPVTIEGRLWSGLPEDKEVKVLLQYVVLHRPSGDSMAEDGCCDVWVLDEVAVLAGSAFCVEVQAKQLVSTYHASKATKKAFAGSQLGSLAGTFHTYFRASVTRIGEQKEAFQVYSPEVYVCGDRNLRRLSCQQHSHA